MKILRQKFGIHGLVRFWILGFSIGWFFIINVLYAGISVDPVTIEVVAPKGGEKVGTVKIGNTGEKTVQIGVSPEKMTGGDKEISTWLTFMPMEFTIEPKKTAEVSYRIIPSEGISGELRCMVFFVADEIGEQKSSVGIRFGVPVYVIVGGTEIIDVEISDVNVEYDISQKVLSGTVFVNNKSNIHIRPYVDLEVYNSKDKLITKFGIPYGQPAQVGQNRPFMFQQNLELAPGKYKLVADVDYGKMYGLKEGIVSEKMAFKVKIDEKEK